MIMQCLPNNQTELLPHPTNCLFTTMTFPIFNYWVRITKTLLRGKKVFSQRR